MTKSNLGITVGNTCICGKQANTDPGATIHCIKCGSGYVYGKDSAALYAVSTVMASALLGWDLNPVTNGFAFVNKNQYNAVLLAAKQKDMLTDDPADTAFMFKGFHCRRCNTDFSTGDTCTAGNTVVLSTQIASGKVAGTKTERPSPKKIAEMRFGSKEVTGMDPLMSLFAWVDKTFPAYLTPYRRGKTCVPVPMEGMELLFQRELFEWYDNYVAEQAALKKSAEQAKPIPVDAPDTFFETVDATPIDDLVASPASPHRDKS